MFILIACTYELSNRKADSQITANIDNADYSPVILPYYSISNYFRLNTAKYTKSEYVAFSQINFIVYHGKYQCDK